MRVKMIAGHELIPGKTVKGHIHVEGTELHVPHVLLCGARPGPTVLISAGIHNAEYAGIQAAIELSNELDVTKLHGNVIILPFANRFGFENRTMSRVCEDGKNLNRVFTGDREGSEADRLAHMLFEVFIKNVDAYIDLHCGDGYETLVPFCCYLGATPAEETAKRMVECVNVKYNVRSRCRDHFVLIESVMNARTPKRAKSEPVLPCGRRVRILCFPRVIPSFRVSYYFSIKSRFFY